MSGQETAWEVERKALAAYIERRRREHGLLPAEAAVLLADGLAQLIALQAGTADEAAAAFDQLGQSVRGMLPIYVEIIHDQKKTE